MQPHSTLEFGTPEWLGRAKHLRLAMMNQLGQSILGEPVIDALIDFQCQVCETTIRASKTVREGNQFHHHGIHLCQSCSFSLLKYHTGRYQRKAEKYRWYVSPECQLRWLARHIGSCDKDWSVVNHAVSAAHDGRNDE